ncbi:MAG: glycerol-3-phosphate dehydrogenase (NAD(P)+) [Gammaproteobacteria bacterium]
MSNNTQSIAVFGAGSWGTALSMQLARNGHNVRLWGHNPAHILTLQQSRKNDQYLPGITLFDNIQPMSDVQACLAKVDYVLIVIPSKAFRPFLQSIRPYLAEGVPVFWASKGFEIETGKLMHELVAEELPGHSCGVLSGPTFAKEVAQGLPAAITCAGSDAVITEQFAELMHGNRFRCYTSKDVIGVELGGALKNVLAIAVGAADGLGFGANTRAALMTRGLSEIMRLGQAMGARQETLMGLAGLGDLILTCTDDQSRNRRFGLAIGQGKSIEQAEIDVQQTVEGLRAAKAIYQMMKERSLDLPIMTQVYRVLYEQVPPAEAVESLESRPLRAEV